MNINELLDKRISKTYTDDEYSFMVNNIGHFTIEQLLKVLKTGTADHLRDVARDELLARSASAPHWTIVPTFWIVVISIIISVIALIISWFAWQRPSQPQSAPMLHQQGTATPNVPHP